jgi:tRNA (guanine37-N1)-methyltransferase
VHNLRDYTHDNYKTVDDRPFGGGPGMVLKPEPIFEAVEALAGENTKVILLSPGGRLFDQGAARELAGGRGCFWFAALTKGWMSGCAGVGR